MAGSRMRFVGMSVEAPRALDFAGPHSFASSTAACAASMALFLISAILASRLCPPVSSTTRFKRNGVASFLPTPCTLASATASAMRASIAACFERVIMWNGIGDQKPAGADLALQADHPGEIVKPVAAMFELEAGGAGVEGRELVGPVADHRDPLGLQELERLPDVEDRFGAGAHDRDAGARKLDEIGGDVECLLGAAVHAADPAGGEDFDARERSDKHRRRDRRACRAFARGDQRQIAPRGLDDAAAELAELIDLLAVERPTLKRPSMTAIVAGTAPISRTASSTDSAVSTLRG